MARDVLLTNIGQLLTMTGEGLGIVENAWLKVRDGRVTEIGRDSGFGIRDSQTGGVPRRSEDEPEREEGEEHRYLDVEQGAGE